MDLLSSKSRLDRDSRHLFFFVSLLCLVIFGYIMDRSLKGPDPSPKASQKVLEFSESSDKAGELISGWGAESIKRLRKAIGWDFGFLLSYAPLLFLGCGFAANGAFRDSRRMRTVGRLLAWGSLVAAAADAVANSAMLVMLGQTTVSSLALRTAQIFASVEFGLLGMVLTYLLSAALVSLLDSPAVDEGAHTS